MIKLPNSKNGLWSVVNSNDKLPDLSATRNLSFEKQGYLRLSKPVISYYSEEDDSDFGLPLFYGKLLAGLYYVLTDEAQFELDMFNFGTSTGGYLSCSQTSATNAPVNNSSFGYMAGGCIFNDQVVYSTFEEIFTHGLSAFSNSWTDRALSSSLGTQPHPLCHDINNQVIAVGNGNTVKTFDTAFAAGTTLTLPNEYKVTGIAYNNGYLGITCDERLGQGNGMFFVWDGYGTSANYAYSIGASTCTSPVAYRGSFAFLNGTGQLMFWTPSRLEVLTEFPSYFSNSHMLIGVSDSNRNESIRVDGDTIYINVKSVLASSTEDQEKYKPEQPSGIWCYSPSTGLYHRHATTSLKSTFEAIATASVNTGTNEISVASAPETGTPTRYSDSDGTTLAGLVSETVYFAIKVDATTIKLALSMADAENDTAVTLTGTGNDNQTLQYYPKSDFGQSYTSSQQGCVWLEESPTQTGQYSNGMFFGCRSANTSTTEYDAGGFVQRDTENRGYFVTAKFQSAQLQDHWQKIFIKHKCLRTDLDKIVVKYRTRDEGSLVKITNDLDGVITWTDASTFTSTDIQFSSVDIGDEVEIIQGAGSGYLAHVSAISEDSGTYTVIVDETIKNLTASDSGRVVVHRWTKLSTITNNSVTNCDGYSELPLGVKSKLIQFKIELRGEDVEIEEVLVANEISKPV